MTNKQYFENGITELSKRVSKIEETLAEFIWKSENPPKFSYGDMVDHFTSKVDGETQVQAKVLERELKETFFGAFPSPPYYWFYTIDVIGIGLLKVPESQLLKREL